ncbi:MAG: hypothetical protein NDJ89_09130 [Oligoflexia bacterium]|nr:hypothetical protein [Oligoflexia bacterium]
MSKNSFDKFKWKWLAIPAAVAGMGISMPSCPGQQAMQQQIDALQASNADLTKKVQMLETQNKTTAQDLSQIKQLLEQMTNAIQGQKGELTQLGTAVKELQARPVPTAPAPKARTKRGR